MGKTKVHPTNKKWTWTIENTFKNDQDFHKWSGITELGLINLCVVDQISFKSALLDPTSYFDSDPDPKFISFRNFLKNK